jgi:CHAT domain-containing protein/Tfp pilus assembly protein PilF
MKRYAAAAVLAVAALFLARALVRDPPGAAEIEEHLARAEAFESDSRLGDALRELRAAAEGARERGEPAVIARALNRLGALQLRRGEHDEVGGLAEEALAAARQAKDPALESDALFNQGLLQYSHGRFRDATSLFEEASRTGSRGKDARREARAALYVGHSAGMIQERERAEKALERARALSREEGDGRGEAEATRMLGQLYSWAGENQKALEYFEQAQELLKRTPDPAAEATISNALGQLYFDMGDMETALGHYQHALEKNRARPLRRREAATLLEIGRCQLELGRHEEARARLEEALAIYRDLGNQSLEADVLTVMGRQSTALGNHEEAFREFEEAIALKNSVGDLRGRALVYDELGTLHRTLGNPEKALAGFLEASERSREADDPLFESLSRYHAALAYRDSGKLEEARAAVEESIRIAETLRANVASQALRTSFLASVHDRYSLLVDLLVELDDETQAFQVTERVRARSLRESLGEAAAGIREGVEPHLLERERALRRQLNELAVESEHLSEAADVERLRGEIAAISTEHDRLQSTIRTRSPRYAELIEPQAASLEEVQRLLDGETRLLAYHLGSERSFVWSITRSAYSVHSLPRGEELEALAREAYRSLKSPGARTSTRRLSEIVMGPLGRIEERRLLVVADGALAYVPFGALDDLGRPGGSGEPLIERYEIARLPSASLARTLVAPIAAEKATRWAAVVADPAYGDGPFRPLPESRNEASRIAELAPPGAVEIVIGAAATREWVERADFRGLRFLHFAAHGVVDDVQPELSGLVLSLVDEKGAPRDGFLRLHDIYNLNLPVELVVLSACETGLGKEVKGEGLIGLVRGFLYAGARGVIASSWAVDDAATAELMTELYRGLFDGRSPAAALREAQAAVSKIPRFRHPYYWAGFEVQAQWR